MERTGRTNNIFVENYQGVLTHEGSIKVAKTNIYGKILNISEETVLILGNKKNSYPVSIHKKLREYMRFAEKGDTAFIKWKDGTPWIVGFKKKPKKQKTNQDWISFFDKMEMEI